MIGYLVKNNIKLILRNKWIVLLIVVAPILCIAVLSSAFEDMLKAYEPAEEFLVGYFMEDDSTYSTYMDTMKEAGEDMGISFLEFSENNPEEMIDKNGLSAFVAFHEAKYVIYETEDYVVEGQTLEYFLHQVELLGKNQLLEAMTGDKTKEILLPMEKMDFMPEVDSKTYYGIVEIVYFIFCGILGAVLLLSAEKKHGIEKKYQVSPLSTFQLYLGRWIPITCVTALEVMLMVILAVLMFDIPMGNYGVVAGVILLSIMASVAFGLMLYYLSRNIAVTVIVLMAVVWCWGMLGGCFETYMYSSFSESIKCCSPIYHVNRTLVEYATIGESSYLGSCIGYLCSILGVCSLISIVADKIRKGGRA